uniref:Putative transformer-2 beta n=2 Tax=Ixodes ricinus TaxID=34613 RepID=V5IF38_IXORI
MSDREGTPEEVHEEEEEAYQQQGNQQQLGDGAGGEAPSEEEEEEEAEEEEEKSRGDEGSPGEEEASQSREVHDRRRPPSRSRSRSRSHSRSSRRRHRHYSHSRSRSRSPRRSSKYYSRGRRSHSRSPMSNRRRHIGSRDNPNASRCLGVFGLSLYTQERDLKEVFSKYGPLEDVQVVYDAQSGRSRGFSFVYFENVEDAKAAKDRCNGLEIDGRKIRVDYSITQRAHTPNSGDLHGQAVLRRRLRRGQRRRRSQQVGGAAAAYRGWPSRDPRPPSPLLQAGARRGLRPVPALARYSPPEVRILLRRSERIAPPFINLQTPFAPPCTVPATIAYHFPAGAKK